MKEELFIFINKKQKVCVPISYYDFRSEERLLIPCTDGEKVGFVNRDGSLIVPPKYDGWEGDCWKEHHSIVVWRKGTFLRKTKKGKLLEESCKFSGAVNHLGEEVLPLEYLSIQPSLSSYYIFTVENHDNQFAVITSYGDIIVPFDKYDKIHGFDKGLAKVRVEDEETCKYKFGIIDEQGNEVIPLVWDRMRSFYKKNLSEIRVSKKGNDGKLIEGTIKLKDLV